MFTAVLGVRGVRDTAVNKSDRISALMDLYPVKDKTIKHTYNHGMLDSNKLREKINYMKIGNRLERYNF